MRELTEQIVREVRACGALVREAKREDFEVDQKGHANFVTTYDKMIQDRLQKALMRLLPEAVFVGEEEDLHASIQKGYAFLVDPIDGTTNFVKDFKMSAISVAVMKDSVPEIGVIYNPYMDEMLTAERGGGAYLNGKPIHVNRRPLSRCLVLFGTAAYNPELRDRTFELAKHYCDVCLDVRRCGSAALDLCYVAAGRGEIFFELHLSPWDFAAGSLMIEEAGGTITDIDGNPLRFDKPSTILAQGVILDE